MYEGRARRFPSGAQSREVIRRDRQCRFPGCSNGTFVTVHHVAPWHPAVGQIWTIWSFFANTTTGGAPKRLVHDRQSQ